MRIDLRVRDDTPCRDCIHSCWDNGYKDIRHTHPKIIVTCTLGQFKQTDRLRSLPDRCGLWKEGGERMGLLDYRNKSENELEGELEKLRQERRGVGRVRRKQSQERKIKTAVSEKNREVRAQKVEEAEEI